MAKQQVPEYMVRSPDFLHHLPSDLAPAREAAEGINGRSSGFFRVNYAPGRARETLANRSWIMKMETSRAIYFRTRQERGPARRAARGGCICYDLMSAAVFSESSICTKRVQLWPASC